ncbi:LytTR family DNA-binding domain-containing protein [Devosia sp.]|uniref:LytTR family DNA-binding domain-containing protein n=1 Tax=Devosia sp. TaxID=1871048 RepID=UPI0032657A96
MMALVISGSDLVPARRGGLVENRCAAMLAPIQMRLRKTKACYVNGSPLQLALREMQRNLTSPRVLTGMAAAIVVLTISGPFNTLDQFDTPHRLIYWLVIVALTYVLSQGVATVALASLDGRLNAMAPRIAIATAVSSVPSWLVVWGTTFVASGGHANVDPLRLWFYCLAIALAIVAVLVVMARTQKLAEPATVPVPPPILERLPHPQRGKLSHISVSDHYIDVVTDKGTTLVLMRLSDAIRETAPIKGVQIHRSHWVALDAVSKVLRVDGKPVVEMRNGARLPVSRGFMAEAKAAGLVV